ncbi:MAG: hypothetical protein DMF63_02465 [Acidobacteria bacterium]|nr:MAG: hypothetical protein DMF63_02465 [Acidobacteriota bacterium]
MIDSSEGKQEIERRDMQRFSKWLSTSKRNERGETYKKYYQRFPVGKYTELEIFAERRFDKAELGYSVSLPKFRYDNNVQMLLPNDLEETAEGIGNLVEHYSGIPFDTLNARQSRTDFVYNFLMSQDEVNRRISVSKLVRSSGQDARIIDKEKGLPSIYFGRKGYRELYLYSKMEETVLRIKQRKAGDDHLQGSIGILRMEDAHYAPKLKQDAERLGLKHITLAALLDSRIAEEILRNDMEQLLLDKPIAGRDERREKLKEHCGQDTAKYARLIGFLDEVNEIGEKEAIKFFGYDYARRARIELTQAGLWLAKENRIPLPALIAPTFENFVIDEATVCGVRSNTSHKLAPVQTLAH